jgi:hypothetical protein
MKIINSNPNFKYYFLILITTSILIKLHSNKIQIKTKITNTTNLERKNNYLKDKNVNIKENNKKVFINYIKYK